jgi:esterase
MELFFRKSGKGDPLIILHGLYGSSDNWYSIARELSANHTVYLIDQRNHGHSPHHADHNYDVMREDLHGFMQKHNLERAIIMGHSMGGKTALAFGIKYPEMIVKMIVVDISPLQYSSRSDSTESVTHERIIRSLLSVHPEQLSSRDEADRILLKTIAPPAIRQFLLKNLKRSADGSFYWAMNIQALADNLPAIFAGVIPGENSGEQVIQDFPLLFIKGEYSGYIRRRDEEAIRHTFPRAQLITIAGSGHWVHAEQPVAFLEAIRSFINTAE